MSRGVPTLGLLLLTFPGVAARVGAQGERGGAVITGTVTDRQSDGAPRQVSLTAFRGF